MKHAPLGALVGLDPAGRAGDGRGLHGGQARHAGQGRPRPFPRPGSGITNTEALGRVLYTKYVYYFQGAGLILLVAMIGAIVLTLRHKVGVKRQSIAAQVARGPKTAVEVVKVASGSAIIPSAEGRG
jgi:NADH-quinone oxidoreductase subunit J